MLLQRGASGWGGCLRSQHLGGQERVVRGSAEEERLGRRRSSDAQTGYVLLELLKERVGRHRSGLLLLLLLKLLLKLQMLLLLVVRVVCSGGGGGSGHCHGLLGA